MGSFFRIAIFNLLHRMHPPSMDDTIIGAGRLRLRSEIPSGDPQATATGGFGVLVKDAGGSGSLMAAATLTSCAGMAQKPDIMQ
jgi:hypothetical protein